MEWISVKDRLPETYPQRCLIFNKKGIGILEYRNIENGKYPFWMSLPSTNGHSCQIGNPNLLPTHWMPLPEPPKETI
jgi:hypothetical protein